jgi:hypothetical protein
VYRDAKQHRLALASAGLEGRGGMSIEENKTLIRRYIEAIDKNDSSDWSILDEFIAEDVVVH